MLDDVEKIEPDVREEDEAGGDFIREGYSRNMFVEILDADEAKLETVRLHFNAFLDVYADRHSVSVFPEEDAWAIGETIIGSEPFFDDGSGLAVIQFDASRRSMPFLLLKLFSVVRREFQMFDFSGGDAKMMRLSNRGCSHLAKKLMEGDVLSDREINYLHTGISECIIPQPDEEESSRIMKMLKKINTRNASGKKICVDVLNDTERI